MEPNEPREPNGAESSAPSLSGLPLPEHPTHRAKLLGMPDGARARAVLPKRLSEISEALADALARLDEPAAREALARARRFGANTGQIPLPLVPKTLGTRVCGWSEAACALGGPEAMELLARAEPSSALEAPRPERILSDDTLHWPRVPDGADAIRVMEWTGATHGEILHALTRASAEAWARFGTDVAEHVLSERGADPWSLLRRERGANSPAPFWARLLDQSRPDGQPDERTRGRAFGLFFGLLADCAAKARDPARLVTWLSKNAFAVCIRICEIPGAVPAAVRAAGADVVAAALLGKDFRKPFLLNLPEDESPADALVPALTELLAKREHPGGAALAPLFQARGHAGWTAELFAAFGPAAGSCEVRASVRCPNPEAFAWESSMIDASAGRSIDRTKRLDVFEGKLRRLGIPPDKRERMLERAAGPSPSVRPKSHVVVPDAARLFLPTLAVSILAGASPAVAEALIRAGADPAEALAALQAAQAASSTPLPNAEAFLPGTPLRSLLEESVLLLEAGSAKDASDRPRL